MNFSVREKQVNIATIRSQNTPNDESEGLIVLCPVTENSIPLLILLLWARISIIAVSVSNAMSNGLSRRILHKSIILYDLADGFDGRIYV